MTSKTKSIIKYVLAIVLLCILFAKTDVSKITDYLSKISPLNIIMAIICVCGAQFFAGMRMRYFFHKSGFELSVKFAIILFYVGAFYNFLLPGGIGGDAYKVMLVRKRLNIHTMQGIKIMVADRASGLCIVMLILFAALWRLDLSAITAYANILLIVCVVITLVAYIGFSKVLLKQSAGTMLGSMQYSLYSQLLWVLTLWALWRSLGNGVHFMEYVTLYCAASITALLPVSVGGLGIKEMTYFYGAMLFQRYTGVTVDGELGITLSLCLFALTFLSSLPGTFWLHKVTHTNMLVQKDQENKAN